MDQAQTPSSSDRPGGWMAVRNLIASAPELRFALFGFIDRMQNPADLDDAELGDEEHVTLDVTLGQLRAAREIIDRSK